MKKSILVSALAMFIVMSACTGPAGPSGWILTIFQRDVYPSNGYTLTKDTVIGEAYPTTTSGSNTNISVGYDSFNLKMRSALHFDLTGVLPSNAKIQKAVLSLRQLGSGGNPSIKAYELESAFSEATMNYYYSGYVTWTDAGADYNHTAISKKQSISNWWHSWTITSTVQKWVTTPSTNYGIILVSDDESGNNYYDYCSAEHTNPVYRPMLKVYYTLD